MPLSVTEPIGFAMTRTGDVLFRPFQFKKWLCIALPAALTLVGEGGGLNFPNGGGGGGGPGHHGGGGPKPQEMVQWLADNWGMILAIGVPILLLVLAIYLYVRWINARGQFMFYDAVVRNSPAIKGPWNEFRHLANSFFKFRLIFDLVVFNLFLVVFIVAGALVWPDVKQWIITEEYPFTGWSIAAIVVAILGSLICMVLTWLLGSIVFHLQLPTMYIRSMEARPALRVAWRELFLPNLGACLLYFLMIFLIRIVQAAWSLFAFLIATVLTCGIACCMMIIPFLNLYVMALLNLPVLAFERAYTLRFLQQFGPDYTVSWGFDADRGFPVVMPPPDAPDSPFAL